MDIFNQTEYTYADISQLIENEVEEHIHLDYKSSGSLAKDDKKKTEISKDVSSFANSDGGIIIYGLMEKDHKPASITFINGKEYTKEWLENIINMIQPRINGVNIYPIRYDNDLNKTIYIVKIPRSDMAPHMAIDKRYYKRFNFSSMPMEDYEVKDILYRHQSPSLYILSASIQKDDEEFCGDKYIQYSFKAWIVNNGNRLCKEYKLSASFFNLPKNIKCSYQPAEGKVLSMLVCDYCFRISSPSKETIFPNETIETGHYTFEIPVDQTDNLNKIYVKLTLQYEDGKKDELLIDPWKDHSLYIEDKDQIVEFIQKDHPDFTAIDLI